MSIDGCLRRLHAYATAHRMAGGGAVPSRRKFIFAVFLVFTGCLGAGCAGGPAGGTAVLPRVGGLEKTTITAAISPVLDSAGFFVALREGLFAQEGLTVHYTPAHGDTVISGAVK